MAQKTSAPAMERISGRSQGAEPPDPLKYLGLGRLVRRGPAYASIHDLPAT
jgi:hypothetical protein